MLTTANGPKCFTFTFENLNICISQTVLITCHLHFEGKADDTFAVMMPLRHLAHIHNWKLQKNRTEECKLSPGIDGTIYI